ncbi:MAG: DNA-binding response regulator [Bacillota bacterium]
MNQLPHRLKVPRVLIVDDDAEFLATLRRILRRHFEILTTTKPVQALSLFALKGPFAVVISDFRMPLMNGVEFFARIAAMDKNVQRIMLTGYAELQMVIDAVNRGKITAFLTKPVSAAFIRAKVTEAIQTYNQQYTAGQNKPRMEKRYDALSANKVAAFVQLLLTTKEKEILALLAKGYSNEEIARELVITIGTVKSHLNHIFCKMDVHSRSKAVAKSIELGIIKPRQAITPAILI